MVRRPHARSRAEQRARNRIAASHEVEHGEALHADREQPTCVEPGGPLEAEPAHRAQVLLGGLPLGAIRAPVLPRSRGLVFAGALDASVSSLEAMRLASCRIEARMGDSTEVMEMLRRSMLRRVWLALLTLSFVTVGFQGAFAQDRGQAAFRPPGLDPQARNELAAVGVNKYVGKFQPSGSEEIGDWTRYTFDTQGGDGPICISGTELTVFHQERDPMKL